MNIARLLKPYTNSKRSNTTLILLDLDGCVAPMSNVPDEEAPLNVVGDWATWQIPLRIQLWLDDLERYTEIRWASTWESYIEPVNAALGVEFEHIVFETESIGNEWFKLNKVREIVESDQYDRIIWIDDDLEEDSRELAMENPKLVLVQPDPAYGISNEEIETINTALKRVE